MILQALTRNNRRQQSCNNQTKTIKKLHTKPHAIVLKAHNYLTIIPRARMGYESIAHNADAEGRMGY